MPLKTFEKIGIAVAVIVIILIAVWLVRIWYSVETQRKEAESLLKEIKEIPTEEEEAPEEFSPEQFLEETRGQLPEGKELPPPAEIFQGPEQIPKP